MKGPLKRKKAAEIFLAVWGAIVLLILPMWGAEAMLAGSAIGLGVYAVLVGDHPRGRGWFSAVIISVAAAIGAAIAIALSRGH